MSIQDYIALYENDILHAIVLTDNIGKITYCNDTWLKMCGFTMDDVMGRTNNILQGFLTEKEIVNELDREVRYGLDVEKVVTNYKKDGSPFKNHVTIKKIEDGFLAEIRDLGKCDYELSYDAAINKRLGLNQEMVTLMV